MRPTSRLLACTTLALSLAACGDGLTNVGNFTDPADGSLRTDRESYVLTRNHDLLETTINVTFENRTGHAVSLATCHGAFPPVIEKSVEGKWVTAFAPISMMCAGPPVVIANGETYEYPFQVVAGAPGSNIGPQFTELPIAGTYRLDWGIMDSANPYSPGSKAIPEAARTSNTFTISL